MKKLLVSNKIYIKKSAIPSAGRGVFAKSDIKKGKIIESCPIIEIPKGDAANLKTSTLVTYFFYFGKNRQRAALALGFGSIYNHSKKPNASFKIKAEDMLIDFIALENIKKGQEITFDYYGSGNKKSRKNPLWFEE